jgi:hypothetical protein
MPAATRSAVQVVSTKACFDDGLSGSLVQVRGHDGRALLSEADGCRPPDVAGCRAGDDGHLVLEASHRSSPLVNASGARNAAGAFGHSSSRADVLACTRCSLIVRCRRPRPRNATVQFNTAAKRFLNPVKNERWTTSHMSHATKPATRMARATPKQTPAVDERRIEYLSLDEITGAARNPKKTDEAGIRRSIERFEFATPALRDEHTGRVSRTVTWGRLG